MARIGGADAGGNVAVIDANQLTAMPVQTIADIGTSPLAGACLTVDVPNDGGVRMHNIVPRLSESPGEIRWAGAMARHHASTELGLL